MGLNPPCGHAAVWTARPPRGAEILRGDAGNGVMAPGGAGRAVRQGLGCRQDRIAGFMPGRAKLAVTGSGIGLPPPRLWVLAGASGIKSGVLPGADTILVSDGALSRPDFIFGRAAGQTRPAPHSAGHA